MLGPSFLINPLIVSPLHICCLRSDPMACRIQAEKKAEQEAEAKKQQEAAAKREALKARAAMFEAK